MLEKDIEKYLHRKVRDVCGGMSYKFVSPGNDGVPDRMVCLPGAVIAFVELKAPGKKPRPLQLVQIERLRKLGFRVEVIDSFEAVDDLVGSLFAESQRRRRTVE